MRNLAILTFVTLDGVMQAPSMPEEDFSGDFKHGGWAAPYWDEVMRQVKVEAMAEPYDILMGRKTYDIFAPHFSDPAADDPQANKLNNAKKYVVTRSPEGLSWQNSIQVTGDIVAEITRLKARQGPLLQVHGSWQLIQMLLANDLVDEFRLWTFPVLVGWGKRLFSEAASSDHLSLVKSAETSQGVVMSIHQRCVLPTAGDDL